MAFDGTIPRNDYIGNGAVATYSFGFRIFDELDLHVTKVNTAGVETPLVWPTDFTVPADAVNNPNGSSITLVAGNLPTNYGLTIRFDRTPQQGTDFRNQGSFFAEVHEDKFDELTRYVQQVIDMLARSIHLPETEAGTPLKTALAAAIFRSNKFLAFDNNGNATLAAGTSANLGPVSGFIDTLLGAASAEVARTTLGCPSNTPPDDVFRVTGSGDFTRKLAWDVDAVTAGVTRTHTVQNQSGIVGLLQNIHANPIINGRMDIWQRGTNFPALSGYAADRWKFIPNGPGAATASKTTSHPTWTDEEQMLQYSLDLTVTTADASPGATSFYILEQFIEGWNWRQFARHTFTLSFWVNSVRTGTHCVSFQNVGQNRSYVATYTVNSASTWEFKTVIVPPSPEAGAWGYENNQGIMVGFALAVGSTFHGAAGSWQTGQFYSTSAQVNLMDTTFNNIQITGVKMELGNVATQALFRSWQEELDLCQRYYQKSFEYVTAPVQNSGTLTGCYIWAAVAAGAVTSRGSSQSRFVSMRGTPTMTFYSPNAASAQAYDSTGAVACTGTAMVSNGESSFSILAVGAAGSANGNLLAVHWTADAEMQ